MSKAKQKHGEPEAEPAADAALEEPSGAGGGEPEDYKAKWQRSLAEMENLRKRQEQEKLHFLRFSLEGFAEELLPVVDNFYRATEHIPAEQQGAPWVTGIQYIQKNLLDTLEKRGVREIPVKAGDAFDPTRHEAIGTAEDAAVPEGHIAEVKNRGYMLYDRVLRPAHVTVSKNPQSH